MAAFWPAVSFAPCFFAFASRTATGAPPSWTMAVTCLLLSDAGVNLPAGPSDA